MKKFEITDNIRRMVCWVDELQKSREFILKPRIFRRREINDVLRYLREVSIAKSELWKAVYAEHSEYDKDKIIRVGMDGVTIDVEEESHETPTDGKR